MDVKTTNHRFSKCLMFSNKLKFDLEIQGWSG